MKRFAPILAAALLGCTAAPMAYAQESDAAFRATTLSLSAFGETKIAPDQALLVCDASS